MESRIKELLEKYWAGTSNLEEEAEIKRYFKENPSLTSEGKYFRKVGELKDVPKAKFSHPGKKEQKSRWSVAAAVIAGLIAAALVFQDAKNQREFAVEDPQEAYEITRQALLMVSSGLNEGKSYSKEITKINKAQEIVLEN